MYRCATAHFFFTRTLKKMKLSQLISFVKILKEHKNDNMTQVILTKDLVKEIHQKWFRYPYDTFQKKGLEAIVNGYNLLVTAGTGCGKSVLAEFAMIAGIESDRKVWVTVPTIALANQFYNSYAPQFNNYDGTFVVRVGLITGNNTINNMGSILIVTAEVLRNKLRTNPTEMENILVVMDEVHNINTMERGTVWEETIATLPKSAQLVMLSATIDSPNKFISYIEKATGCRTQHTFNNKRVVPLHILVPELRTITENTNYPRDEDFIELMNTDAKDSFAISTYETWKKEYVLNTKSTGHKLSCLTSMLRIHDKFPAIIFAFSRKRNEEYANTISTNLLTSCESTEMKHDVKRMLGRAMYESLYTLESFRNLEAMLCKGVAYHHGGMLPILKELVEMLFREKKIKLLFATETLAVGVNMPTRTVVFTDLKKPTQNGFTLIGSDVYGQMSGRAGRRGMDTKGFVVWCPLGRAVIPRSYDFQKIVNGGMPKINSKFITTPHFVLQNISNEPSEVVGRLWRQIQNKGISNGIEFEIRELEADLEGIVFPEKLHTYYEFERKLEDPTSYLSSKETMKLRKRMRNYQQDVADFKAQSVLYRKLIRIQTLRDESKASEDSLLVDWEVGRDILVKHCFIDKTNQPTLCGELAQKINESDPLVIGWVLGELIHHPELERITYVEIVAWLSVLLESPYGRREEDNQIVDPKFRCGYIDELLSETEYAARSLDSKHGLNYRNAELITTWLSGGKNITQVLNSIDSHNQGTFVKLILRLVNLIDNLRSCFEEHKCFYLYNLLEDSADQLMFDLVSNNSLYLV